MIKKLKMYINGEWVDSSSGEIIEITNPATGAVIATVPKATSEDIERAVRAAYEAKQAFKETPVTERVELCYRVAKEIEKNLESMAKWLTMEQGKPYHSDSLWEVSTVAGKYRICAEELKRLHGELVYSNIPGKK